MNHRFANQQGAGPEGESNASRAALAIMPQVLLALLEQCQAEPFDPAEIAPLVASDPAAAFVVLAQARRDDAQGSGPGASIEGALARLGDGLFRTLVADQAADRLFERSMNGVDSESVFGWRGCVTAALLAQAIASKIGYPSVEEAYLAGLFLDVGRMLGSGGGAGRVDRTAAPGESERGARLIDELQLDSFIADAVRYQREPADRLRDAHPLVRIAALARHLAAESGEAPMALCGLGDADAEPLRDEALQRLRRTAGRLAIAIDASSSGAAGDGPASAASLRRRIGAELRHMALAAHIAQTLAGCRNEDEVVDAIVRAARLLRSDCRPVLLFADPGATLLACPPRLADTARLAAIRLPLTADAAPAASDPGRPMGALARAWAERRIAALDAADASIAVSEAQLLRLLDAESAIAIPLVDSERGIGMLMLALREGAIDLSFGPRRLLLGFGTQAASALARVRRQRAEIDERAARVADEARLATRRIAHEVTNPLTIVKNYLTLFQRQLSRQQLPTDQVAVVYEEVERIETMIAALGEAAPVQPVQAVGVESLVESVVRFFEDSGFAASITFRTGVEGQPGAFDGDAQALRQILVNLIKNAIEAMPDGGTIEIRCSGPVAFAGRRHVELWVRDDGPGLPAHVMANLFSGAVRRQTPSRRGLGLGLGIVQTMVEGLGGLISCRSGAEGTAFQLLLPASVGPGERAEATAANAAGA